MIKGERTDDIAKQYRLKLKHVQAIISASSKDMNGLATKLKEKDLGEQQDSDILNLIEQNIDRNE